MSKKHFDSQYIGTEYAGRGPNIGYNIRKWSHEANNGLNDLSGKKSMAKRRHELNSSRNGNYRSKKKAPTYLSAQYKKQNVIGVDIQPIDPMFHVYRPINLWAIETHPDMAAADIIEKSGGKYGQEQAWELITNMGSNGVHAKIPSCGPVLSKSEYYKILRSVSPYATNREVALSLATGKSSFPSTPTTPLGDLAPYQTALTDYMQNREYKYECRLFNFYADNSKFFSGTIQISGRIGYEYGVRLIWFDQRRRYAWEFYLTGVSHDFNYQNGWTTTLTVERGLPFTFKEAESYLKESSTKDEWLRDQEVTDVNGKVIDDVGKPIMGNFNKRFTDSMWGHAEPFIGGFFGEQTLASMLDQANAREKAYMTKFTGGGSSSSGSSSSSTSDDIVSYAKSQIGKHPYVYGSREIITEKGKPGSTGDCAGFTWLCAYHCGYKCPSGGWEGSRDLSEWCKKVSASDAKAGDFITTSDHHMVMGSNYHGGNTDIINLGGDRTSACHGKNVQEGKLSMQVDTPISDNDYWEPEKK